MTCLLHIMAVIFVAMMMARGELDVNVSDSGGCLYCPQHDDVGVHFFTKKGTMPPHSALWGVELTRPFLSRVYWTPTKTAWQARTVTTTDENGNEHHILLPFIINAGGVSSSLMVGEAAVAVLSKFGSESGPMPVQRRMTSNSLRSSSTSKFCNLHVPLPIKAHHCVMQWRRPTSQNSIDHASERLLVHDIRKCTSFSLNCQCNDDSDALFRSNCRKQRDWQASRRCYFSY